MRTFVTPNSTELPLMDIKGKPYLAVQHRIMWFREEHPDWTVETEIVLTNEKETLARAIIRDSSGRVMSTGHKSETQKGFADHMEKAESGAVGRALGFLGYGTQFALELEEGERLVDSPVEAKVKPPKELPPNAHVEAIAANDDSYHYLIQAGSLEGRLIGEVETGVLAKKLEEAKAWLAKNGITHPMSQKIKEFAEHADNYLTQSGQEDVEMIEPKGPKASSGLVAKLIKGYQLKGIDAHKLNGMLASEFDEGFPNLTDGTAKVMLARLDK
jgi:hypothetical protein